MADRVERVQLQLFIPCRPIKPLDIGILSRLAPPLDDIEGSQCSTVDQRVTHKIHRPYLAESRRYSQGIRLISLQASPGLDAQVQLKLPINAVNAIMIPSVIPHIAQMLVAKPKPSALIGRR